MNTFVPAWFCEHQKTVAVGETRHHWKLYCQANRRCEIGDAGCHELVVPSELADKATTRLEPTPGNGVISRATFRAYLENL